MSNNNMYLAAQNTTTFYLVDLDNGNATQLAGPPFNFASGAGSCGWDGAYVYAVLNGGSNSALFARYEPLTNSWSILNNGTPFGTLSGNPTPALACDGVAVYIAMSQAIYAFQLSTGVLSEIGTFTYAGGGSTAQLIWDGANNLYVFPTGWGNALTCSKFNLTTRATQNAYTTTGAPASPNAGAGAYQTFAFSNGVICAVAYAWSGYTSTLTVYSGVDSGSAIAFTAHVITLPTQLQVNSEQFGFAISPSVIFYPTEQFNYSGYLITVGSWAVTTAAYSVGSSALLCNCGVYTNLIQGVFQWFEQDGITPQATTEPFGGSGTVYFPNQNAGPIAYNLKCLYPRTSVTVSVVPNASQPLASACQVASSPGGPWGSSVNMGSFAAGQQKAYYVQFSVPSNTTIGTQNFSLTAVGTS
nr:hypothetical protein [uncultured Rhodopila sp.]